MYNCTFDDDSCPESEGICVPQCIFNNEPGVMVPISGCMQYLCNNNDAFDDGACVSYRDANGKC